MVAGIERSDYGVIIASMNGRDDRVNVTRLLSSAM